MPDPTWVGCLVPDPTRNTRAMTRDPAHPSPTSRSWREDTVAVTAGRPHKTPDAPMNQPIVLASTYVGGGEVGYGRYGNPSWTALEEAIGALEGGRALTFSSGMAAVQAVFDLIPADGVLVLPEQCYLGVIGAAQARAERFGLQVRLVDVTDTGTVLAAAEDADLVWLESPTNPTMEVADLVGLGGELGMFDCLVAVDNTFATPLLQQPLVLGADLVIHSATKFLSGHSDAVLGAVVLPAGDRDNFAALETTRRMAGAIPGALESYLVLRGLRTLHLRVARAQQTAELLVAKLADHDAVRRVYYPGLPDSLGYRFATAQMSGFGALLSVDLGSAEAADQFVEAAQLWVHATSLGGVESTLERRRRWAGESVLVPEGLVRLSVGIEHPDDLLADLLQALDQLD